MPDTMTPIQYVAIKNVGGRKHPQYDAKSELWNFLLASWRGGLGMAYRLGITEQQAADLKFHGYFPGLFRFRQEAYADYITRIAMSPYVPIARQIVEEYVRYVTKDAPTRNGAEAWSEFVANTDRTGREMPLFIRDTLALSLVMGEVGVLVDMPPALSPVVSQADMTAQGLRAYASIVLPQSIVDWSVAENGKYEWVIIETTALNNTIENDKAQAVTRRTYWDRNVWQTYETAEDVNGAQKKTEWGLVSSGEHPCGEVPIVRIVTSDVDRNALTPESWFFDLADMNRAIYNLDSNDIANLCHSRSVLILPPGNESETVILSRSHALTEDPETNGITRYVERTDAEGESYDRKINELKTRMYMVAGLQYRTGQNVPESGISKAWDFQRVNQFLAGLAKTANWVETRMSEHAAAWEGNKTPYTATYPTDYAVHELQEVIEAILGIKQIGFATETGRKEALKRIYRETLPDLPQDKARAIETEIDASTEPDPLAGFDMNRQENTVTEQE